MFEITFAARMLQKMGCKVLVATNASGGCQVGMFPGCLMVIEDHINIYARNPLADACEHEALLLNRNPDFSSLYSKRLRQISTEIAKESNLKLFYGNNMVHNNNNNIIYCKMI
jgi:purine-nucleoside phosphorylase